MSTPDGRPILAALRALPAHLPTVAVVRHAERHPIHDLATADAVLLTPAGVEAARTFGGALPAGRPVQLWHSRVERCGMTARAIAEGVTAAGGRAACGGVLDGLCGAFVRDFDGVVALTRQFPGGGGSEGFVRRWFDGHFDPAMIDPCHVAAGKLLSCVARALAAAVPGNLVVLVTHDWEIMTLRETYLGARHDNVGWVDFLDGLVITRHPQAWQFRWQDLLSTHPA